MAAPRIRRAIRGEGLSFDRRAGDYIIGSARRAVGYPFSHYAFNDLDTRATGALATRLTRDAVSKAYAVYNHDCNAVVPLIRSFLPTGSLSLVFVDPTAFQMRMDSLVELSRARHMDLLVTFHTGSLLRVGSRDAPVVDAFFGTDRWRAAFDGPRSDRLASLVRTYNEELARQANYLPGAFQNAVAVKNSRGVTMYHLVLFSRHPLGEKFWHEAAVVDELGQRTIWELQPE
jgi:three-Cys-motif partner protein